MLKKWEIAKPADPELFIAYFNYYVQQSGRELISLDQAKRNTGSFQLTDSATGKPVAYLNSSVKYNSAILQKGFDYVDKGLALYPTRLDMRFGKIYMLGQAENYPAFTNYLVETIDYGNSIKDAWTWKEGKTLEDAKQFFLSSMQDYVTTIYNTEDDSLLPLIRQISETVLKYNPNDVESLANVALTYLVIGEYDKALEYLLKAEKIAPKDTIVLNNIAQAYYGKKDNTNARAYYEKIIKVGTADEVKDAKEKLKHIN